MTIIPSKSSSGIITGVFVLLYTFCAAQSGNREEVKAAYDPGSIPEVINTIPVGFTFYLSGNHQESTKGFLQGQIRWNSLEVSSPQGIVHNGQFTFNREKIWQNGHEADFEIKMRGKVINCKLPLPYVKKIRFNLYTDSLKKGEPFYLNVEGKFSSGRTYPLDTGMVAFCKSGGGKLAGQSLLVSHQDTGTHVIMVYSRLKMDPQIRDSILVPVKILPNPVNLPTEQEVLQSR
jgi:hypothetical protein